MKIKISNADIQALLTNKTFKYPKYATQIINLANSNAQGTRPKVVGQMSELIQEFQGESISEWEHWYKESHPNSIDDATDKIFKMIEHLKESIANIDRGVVRQWVEELVIVKTFTGLKFQEAILRKIAESKQTSYRLATVDEESQGIDGYIGDMAVSIKANTYLAKDMLPEHINMPMIYYTKRKSDIVVEYDF